MVGGGGKGEIRGQVWSKHLLYLNENVMKLITLLN